MKFCSTCGEHISQKIPLGDNRLRYVCDACQTIHYQNPRIIAGCIAEHENKILLCKRAIEPRLGLWTLPAGFMENNETTLQAAARESYEEANANILNMSLYCTYSIPHISQVYMMYRGTLVNGFSAAGEESLETRLYAEADIPWDQLAFPVITETLKLYFADKRNKNFKPRDGEIYRDDKQQIIVKNYNFEST